MDRTDKPYKFVVRLPLPLRSQIAEAAKYYRRSMNSEIVARLEQSFSGIPTAATADAIAPPLQQTLESFFVNSALSKTEADVLRAYRRLPESKRAALLELLQ